MKYENIIISPHIDDAVFSLGGLLLQNRHRKQKIVDVFSISDFHFLEKKLSEREVTAIRREEELTNAKKLNASVDFLPFPEPHLKTTDRSRIKSKLKNYIKQGRRIFFPLAIGSQRAHVIISRIGLELLSETRTKNIYFYEDLPYAVKMTKMFRLVKPLLGNSVAAEELYPLVNIAKGRGMLSSEKISIDLEEKMELCEEYKSQTNWRILTSIAMYSRILGFLNGSKERIWKIKDLELVRKILASG